VECEAGTFSISSEHGCTVRSSGEDGWAGGCDNRACIACVDGATCSKGSTASWKHFVPKPLQLGGQVLPWVSVIHGGKTVSLFCNQESMTCAPPFAAASATARPGAASPDDHVWEFDELISQFVLKQCPPGHQLVNSSSGGVFNPTLQLCSACGPSTYIIDQLHPCVKCPQGASCDGVRFESNAEGSEWEEELASDGSGLQKRILSCPAGFMMKREPLFPQQDDCVLCPEGTYRLTPVVWQDVNNGSLPDCHSCPTGAVCPGGNVVEAKANFWRLQTLVWGSYEYLDAASDVCVDATESTECLFPAKNHWVKVWSDAPMHCTWLAEVSPNLVCARPAFNTALQRHTGFANRRAPNDSTLNGGIVRVYPCLLGACGSNNSCMQKRTGPLCGYCSRMQSRLWAAVQPHVPRKRTLPRCAWL